MAPNEQDIIRELNVEVDVRKLPSFSKLNEKVQRIVKSSSQWELYGVDIMHMLVACSLVPLALIMMNMNNTITFILATFILGYYHSSLANKGGHCVTHGSIIQSSERMKKLFARFFLDFIGSYSSYMAAHIHVDIHHPYTNIIGLGDSSSWKVPFLGRKMYLFCAPLLLPLVTPLVAVQQLIEANKLKELFKFLPLLFAGLAFHVYILIKFAGFTVLSAFPYLFVYRAVFSIPYIHINIFQHIGLPMYSQKSKPPRIYQMSSGVLNLPSHPILDLPFGHSLISCHVEHHLFPRLSDNMCLKIKPVVCAYLKDNNLNYNEDTYINRLKDFYNRYDELMVYAPPITHFVGIQ